MAQMGTTLDIRKGSIQEWYPVCVNRVNQMAHFSASADFVGFYPDVHGLCLLDEFIANRGMGYAD